MSKQGTGSEGLGWVVAGIIGFILLMFFLNSNSHKDSVTRPPNTTPSYSQPAPEITTDPTPSQPDKSWHCVDATSYNHNAYDDNRCTNGTKTRYVSDSQAVELDPSYRPGKAGASYYNNQ